MLAAEATAQCEASKMKKHAAERTPIALAVMTVKELSAYPHVHPTTICRLLRRGQILGFRIDGGWRFHIKAIDQWRAQKEIGGRQRSEKLRKNNPSGGSALRVSSGA